LGILAGGVPALSDLEGTATLSHDASLSGGANLRADKPCLHLTILWSRHEPERVAECGAVPRTVLLGRGPELGPGDPPKIEFGRSRPGELMPTGALLAPTLSRRQWRLTPSGATLGVENLGKRDLWHNGLPVKECQAKPGDTLGVDGVFLVQVTERPRLLPKFDYPKFNFGDPDQEGLIGESVESWELRQELFLLSRSRAHTLILGDSGSGKELCAQGIHRASIRGEKSLISRNAATIPASLAEAELFGQARNYPNAGSPARDGLIGLAHQSSLFLDEIGELAEAQQASLLRVLDAGEYQRLGEDQLRKSDVRVLCATNRSPETLKFDLLARFAERLVVPNLNSRRADVPLLIRHIAAALLSEGAVSEPLGPTQRLVEALARHQYTLHYRELERLVRLSSKGSAPGKLDLTDALAAELNLEAPATPLDPEQVRAVLAQSKSASEAAHRLGLSNRYALYRLLKRLGIEAA
jgi:two-component system nitrogen regulation response regulator GlnG/two-component system response regulator HydG